MKESTGELCGVKGRSISSNPDHHLLCSFQFCLPSRLEAGNQFKVVQAGRPFGCLNLFDIHPWRFKLPMWATDCSLSHFLLGQAGAAVLWSCDIIAASISFLFKDVSCFTKAVWQKLSPCLQERKHIGYPSGATEQSFLWISGQFEWGTLLEAV